MSDDPIPELQAKHRPALDVDNRNWEEMERFYLARIEALESKIKELESLAWRPADDYLK